MYKSLARNKNFLERTGSYATRPSRLGHHPDLAAAQSRALSLAEHFNIPTLESEHKLAVSRIASTRKDYQSLGHLSSRHPRRKSAYCNYMRAQASVSVLKQKSKNARTIARATAFDITLVESTQDPTLSKQADLSKAHAFLTQHEDIFFDLAYQRADALATKNRQVLNSLQQDVDQVLASMKDMRNQISQRSHIYDIPQSLTHEISELAHQNFLDVFEEMDR